ncbi:uncharacterized protein LOC143242170 isoform X2 [Tachypleus tridentatus]|uniref:uncharacterized protein LOC143242170 isoform X2 n=1 Tax=Tachypleus tridentatus TaxID=6853 RepID=UPI003FD3D768
MKKIRKHTTIKRLWNRHQQHGSTRDRPRSGRPRVTTPAQDHYIRLRHLRDRTTTATSTASTVLLHIRGNLTAQRYVDEILKPHVQPIMVNFNDVFNMTTPVLTHPDSRLSS